ncbi:MAG TPA: GNAT family N-acetyltransferase [Casimicrobiaceae bacterium]|nr:GNAT family N-acetyltransferase [Casimicrobiaceae bacterium]
MQVTQTERLLLRWLTPGDAEFIRELVNEPSWIEYIGDKGVRTREDAARYLENGPLAMYRKLGYGLYCVESKELARPIGICGLIKRDTLDDVDIGFAFLPRYWGQGYAFESASAILTYGRRILGLSRVVAILSQDNERSRKLLGALGFAFERTVAMTPGGEALSLHAVSL